MFNRFMEWLVDGIRLRLVGPTLLQDIPLLDLGSSLDDATKLYGPHTETIPNEDFPEAIGYSFEPSQYHAVDVWIWRSQVSAVVYHSAKGEPELDLKTVWSKYGETQEWRAVNEGYTYLRADGRVRLWCSAVPAIGVGIEEYMQADANYRSVSARPSE
jgi:hypothetical protein